MISVLLCYEILNITYKLHRKYGYFILVYCSIFVPFGSF